jgi:hypothetical protein
MAVEAVAGMAGAVEAVDFTAGAVVVALLGFTVGAVVAGMAEAVGFTGLLPMDLAAAGFMGLPATVAGLTWVMAGVAMR